MIDSNLTFRTGDAIVKYDDKNQPTTLAAANGMTNTTFTSSWLDLGSSLKQIPLDGMSVLITLPLAPITSTGATGSCTLTAKIDFGDDASTALSTVQGQAITFTFASSASSAFTYSKDGTASTSVALPASLKLNLPYVVHRYARLTLTTAMTTVTGVAYGNVNAWLDVQVGVGGPFIELN